MGDEAAATGRLHFLLNQPSAPPGQDLQAREPGRESVGMPMTVCGRGRLLVLILGTLTAASVGPARSDEVRIGGTGAALALTRSLSAAFAAAQPTDRLDVAVGLGSGGAIAAVAEGVLQIAVAGRGLTAEETAKGMASVPFLRTPFIFVTARAPAPKLTTANVVAIHAGGLRTWPGGANIKPILRPRADAATLFLTEHVPGMAAAMESLRKRPDVPVAATDQDNIETAEQIAGSFAGTTLLQVTTERPRVNIIALDGVVPSVESMEAGAYPLAQDLYLVTAAEPSAVTRRFLAWVRSSAGRAIIRAGGARPALGN